MVDKTQESPAQDKPTKGGKKKPPSRKVEKPSSPPTAAGKQPAGGSFKTRQVSRAQTAGECITQLAVQLQSEVAESHYCSCVWKSIMNTATQE